MNTLGSHPGAIIFRLSVMLVIILILIVIFFSYVDKSQRGFESASISQTKTIVDSTLAVVFANYTVQGRLGEIGELDGANPFELMAQRSLPTEEGWGLKPQLLPAAYRGTLERDPDADAVPGWYYLKHRQLAVYLPTYLERPRYFALVLKYDDLNTSGQFEVESDLFKSLQFVEQPTPG